MTHKTAHKRLNINYFKERLIHFNGTVVTSGNEQWQGKAFGVEGNVTVMKNPARLTFTEKKFYNKAQVRKRVLAYKDAFEELSGCTAKENTLGWNSDEGGTVKIPINSGYIEISYANCDEVEFSSKDYTLMIVFSE